LSAVTVDAVREQDFPTGLHFCKALVTYVQSMRAVINALE